MPLRAGAAVSSVLLLVVAYYLIEKAVGRPWRYVRLRPVKPGLALYSILATVALIPLAGSLMAVLISHFNVPEEWLELPYHLIRAGDLRELFYVWVVSALLVGAGEELVFRGVLQNSLSRKFRGWVAVLIASAVFGILHAWRFPVAFGLGAFLGTLYLVTGSLVVPVIAHITINSVAVLGSFVLERTDPESIPDWVVENESAPALVLVVSISVFALFMYLILKEAAAAGDRRKPDPDLGGDGGP